MVWTLLFPDSLDIDDFDSGVLARIRDLTATSRGVLAATLSNLLAAMREGLFFARSRGAQRRDAMGEVMTEVNALSETLREQRLGALEATALLRTVMEEIDVAVFTFDSSEKLKLVNRAGTLVESPRGKIARPDCHGSRTTNLPRRRASKDHGVEFLRRLRPLGNATRNVSAGRIATPACGIDGPEPSAAGRRAAGMATADSRAGSRIEFSGPDSVRCTEPGNQFVAIGNSAWRWCAVRRHAAGIEYHPVSYESLGRFMAAYTQLGAAAKADNCVCDFAELVRRVVALERRAPVELVEGPAGIIQADRDQVEQLLINLLQNAVDAAAETRRQGAN